MTTATKQPKPFKQARPIPAKDTLKGISSGRAEIYKLDPRFIQREPGFNTRYDFGDITALAEDIAANGILEPLKVRKEEAAIYLVNGDRRLTAIEHLIAAGRWPEDPVNKGYPMPVPCASEPRNVKPLDRIFMMLSLNTGKPFTLLEKGYAYLRILEADPEINASAIALRSGETKQAVSNALALVRSASPKLIRLIKEGTIAATTALEILKAYPHHENQDTTAAAALESAKTNGRTHATPKDLAPASKPATTAPQWTYSPSKEFGWNTNDVATKPTSITLAAKAPFKAIQLLVAPSTARKWHFSYRYESTTECRGGGGLPSKSKERSTPSFPDESSAVIAAWKDIAPTLLSIVRLTKGDHAPIQQWLIAAGNALHAKFATGTDHDDSIFDIDPTAGAYIAPQEDDDDSDSSDSSDQSDSSPASNSDSPSDPSAFQRLKDAPSSHRDGSSGSAPGPGFASPDARLKNLEKLMDELDQDVISPKKWGTAEVILDYLNGNHPISTVRNFIIA